MISEEKEHENVHGTDKSKNTSHRCKYDRDDCWYKILSDSTLHDLKSNQKYFAVNKMLFVLIFLIVK